MVQRNILAIICFFIASLANGQELTITSGGDIPVPTARELEQMINDKEELANIQNNIIEVRNLMLGLARKDVERLRELAYKKAVWVHLGVSMEDATFLLEAVYPNEYYECYAKVLAAEAEFLPLQKASSVLLADLWKKIGLYYPKYETISLIMERHFSK
jgi:hypothetical protein